MWALLSSGREPAIFRGKNNLSWKQSLNISQKKIHTEYSPPDSPKRCFGYSVSLKKRGYQRKVGRPLGGGKACPRMCVRGGEAELSSSTGTAHRAVFGVRLLLSLAEGRHAHGEKVLPVPSTSKRALPLRALQLQLVLLLKPPCLQGLRKYRMCLTSSTNVKHKWSWVGGSSPLKHAFETLQSSKLAYIPCAAIHSLLFCIVFVLMR